MNDIRAFTDDLFTASSAVRYVAVLVGREPVLRQRHEIDSASSSSTDRFEELLVNPTVLTVTRQRGEIDCGGLDYVLIRHGHFFQFVQPIEDGHVSVALDAHEGLMGTVELVREVVARGQHS